MSARDSHGGEGRIRAARFPGRKSLEEFDFDHARGLRRDLIAHLGTLDFVTAKDNVLLLGPPGTGKTHLATGLAIRACQAGHRVLFATAAQWVTRLAEAHNTGRLQDELVRLGRYPLLVIDEVGYIPFEPEAANLFFQLVSSRYERASLIVTSNKPFGRWGEVFGDEVVAAAMIDRLASAHATGKLQAELARLARYPLLVIDEVGYIPFEPEAANLFFQLVSARYERASLIVTSNKPFGRWGEVFGDDVVAAAMIDRLVHHAEVIALKGDSYRLKDRDLGRVPAATNQEEN